MRTRFDQADHGGLHIQRIGGDDSARDSALSAKNYVTTVDVAQNSNRQVGSRFGCGRCLGSGERDVIAVAAAQGAGRSDNHGAVGAQSDGAVKRFSLVDQQVAGIDNFNISRAYELQQRQCGDIGLQADGAVGHHTQHIGTDQAGNNLHSHVIGCADRSFGVDTSHPGLSHAASPGAERDCGTASSGFKRTAAQADAATVSAGGQTQCRRGDCAICCHSHGICCSSCQTGVAVGRDAAVFGRTYPCQHRDGAGIDCATEVNAAIRGQRNVAKTGANAGTYPAAKVQGDTGKQTDAGSGLQAALAGFEHG